MPKRTFEDIRNQILKVLRKGPLSITALAKVTNSTWRTTKSHLSWLEKMEGKVRLIKKSEHETVYASVK